jgi:oligoendopeptidase F
MLRNADIQKLPRTFIPTDLVLNSFADIQPFYEKLLATELESKVALENWLTQVSELQCAISEDACWRQIKMTCDTTDKKLEEAYTFFCTDIQPHIQVQEDLLNKKLMACSFINELDANIYKNYLRTTQKDIELFVPNNIELQSQESILAQQYGSISSKMSIEVNGQEYTLQQAAKFLMQSDAKLREEVFAKVAAKRMQDTDALNELFNKLVQVRHQIALNAGFENYRDYKFKELGRFDYTVQDCINFQEAIKKHILPLCEKIFAHKKKVLGLAVLKPYDVDAEPAGQEPLTPFANGADLIEKSIQVFDKLNPYFGDALRKMKAINHFDLDSRKGKAPGGYNCPLAETGVPFIFMNAASTADDVVTMMHEGGHALHSFLCHSLPLNALKEYPMEMAELASMSMELMTMEYWDVFYTNPNELQRAKIEELERVLTILPWIAIIDKFQHWVYTHPTHTNAERTNTWNKIVAEFSTNSVDWSDWEDYHAIYWQKQLHLFEVPFYYIEYGIAQLGAIGMWMQYKKNASQAIDNYINALSLGYTADLHALYKTAGISFDFSDAQVQKLSAFVNAEMDAIMH